MSAYIVRRLIFSVLVVLGVSIITFTLVQISPADPALLLGGSKSRGVGLDALRKQLGLDQPAHVQYLRYIARLIRGDLGESWWLKRPVTECIASRFPATAILALSIMAVAVAISFPIGLLAALRAHSIFDHVTMIAGMMLVSVPGFLFGLSLIYAFSFRLRLLPIGGYGTVRHLVLPTLSVALPWAAWYAVLLRSNMLDVMSADYVRTAYAKGLHQRTVMWRHVLRNALMPLVTVLGMDLAYLLTGIALVEYVFNWPGIGRLAVQAAQHLDVPMVMGTVLLGASLIVLGNLAVDLLYSLLDPRVRLS